MRLFVNTKTKECGMYETMPSNDWIEAPKGTQAVYNPKEESQFIYFYKIEDGVLLLWCHIGCWRISTYTPELLAESPFMTHLWGTLPDFEF